MDVLAAFGDARLLRLTAAERAEVAILRQALPPPRVARQVFGPEQHWVAPPLEELGVKKEQ